MLNLDYTAQKTFGKWTAGVVGYWVYQTGDDKIDGAIVPAGALGTGNGTGNRFEKFALGRASPMTSARSPRTSVTRATSTPRTPR